MVETTRVVGRILGAGITALTIGCYTGISAGGTDATVGDESGDGGSDAGEGGTGSEGDGAPLDCAAPNPGPAPIRRLTRTELDNTLRDLLGDEAALAHLGLPSDVQVRIFDTDIESHGITEELAFSYLQLAEAAAEAATADVESLVGCDPAQGDACAREYVTATCPRAWRRPCDAAEIDALVELFADGETFRDGIRLVLEVMLQSAEFLYRPEVGDMNAEDGGVVPLTSWEVASRLSYLVWGSMPDEALFDLAAEDRLQDPKVIASEVERMLEDPRAADRIVWFHDQWLSLTELDRTDKDLGLYPGFVDVRDDMRREAAMFVQSVVLGGGTLEELLRAPYTFANDELAAWYGLPAPGTDEELAQISLPEDRHAGILTMGALLSVGGNQASSSPVRRGLTVLRQVLCGNTPPPPPDVMGSVPPPSPGTTTRERFEVHTTDPSCAGCHQSFDPIGFAFEHFDAAGRWRDLENDLPVDASADLKGTDVDGPVDGAADLAARLSQSAQVRACYVAHVFEFHAGRRVEDADACTIEALEADFAAADQPIVSLYTALAQSDAFRYRRIEP